MDVEGPVTAAFLDELAANGTAATTTMLLDGWILRAQHDLPFRRSNCVLPWGGAREVPADRLAARIDLVEGFYARRVLPVYFQVGVHARPEGLDAALAARGYEVDAPVDVLVASTGDVLARTAGRAGVSTQTAGPLDGTWAAEYGAAFSDDPTIRARIEAYGRMLPTIGPEHVTVSVRVDGSVAGVGHGVVERGWLGVFGMGTRHEMRRRGVATAALHALATAAAERAAPRMYLQVESDNDAGRALYEQAGFRPHHAHHYRRLGTREPGT